MATQMPHAFRRSLFERTLAAIFGRDPHPTSTDAGWDTDPALQEPVLQLDANGMLPVADCADGFTAEIPLHDESGVKSGVIFGTTGSGKSLSAAAVILPGVIAGLEAVVYLDGRGGTSLSTELEPALTTVALEAWQWRAAIEMVHQILIDRMTYRGQQRQTAWRVGFEVEPIITLLIDEAGTVNQALRDRHVRMVTEMIRDGRVLGVRVVQVCDSASAENLIGGITARNLMISGGWAICHRAGSAHASRLALDSTPDRVDLRGLRAGEVAVLVEGRLAGFPAQIRYLSPAAIAAALAGHVVHQLPGTNWHAPRRSRPMDTLFQHLSAALDDTEHTANPSGEEPQPGTGESTQMRDVLTEAQRDGVEVWVIEDPKTGHGVPVELGDDESQLGGDR